MDFIVTMRHVRQAGMCARGARAFAKKYELDWSSFLKNGIPASKLEATGDALALKVVEVARGKQ